MFLFVFQSSVFQETKSVIRVYERKIKPVFQPGSDNTRELIMGVDEITACDVPSDKTDKIIREFWEKIIQVTTIQNRFWTSLEMDETDVSRDIFHSP